MPKNKRRRMQQRQESQSMPAATDAADGSPVKMTEYSQPGWSNSKKASSLPVTDGHSSCAATCCEYDAVILHSVRDGKTALDVKKWMEGNLSLPHGGSTHPPKVELMGTINPNYVTSLETASTCTKTIIILCTKHFDEDALFKKAIHALWAWEADKDLRIIPLLIGFEKDLSPPECIPVRESHIIYFKRECEYFQYVMTQHLSRSLAGRLQHEQRSKERYERKDGKTEQPILHSTDVYANDYRPRDYEEVVTDEHASVSSGYASGVVSNIATTSGLTSVLASLPSTDDSSLHDSSSLSGPCGLQNTPWGTSTQTVSPFPGGSTDAKTSERLLKISPGTSGSNFSNEGTNGSQDGNSYEERHKNGDKYVETTSEAAQEQNADMSVPKSSTSVMKEDSKCECSKPGQVKQADKSSGNTKHTPSSLTTTPSVSAANQHNGDSLFLPTLDATQSLPGGTDSVFEHLDSWRAQNRSDLQENRDSGTPAENPTIDRNASAWLVVHQDCDPAAELEQRKSELTDDTDAKTRSQRLYDCPPTSVEKSADESQMSLKTSDSRSEKGECSVAAKPPTGAKSSPKEPPRKRLEKVPSDACYLTPVPCIEDRESCTRCHGTDGSEDLFTDQKLPDRENFESNHLPLFVNVEPLIAREITAEIQLRSGQQGTDIITERQKKLLNPATMRPPNHTYVNTDRKGHPDHTPMRAKKLTSMARSCSSAVHATSPAGESQKAAVTADTDEGYNTSAGSVASVCTAGRFPSTIGIRHANSVIIHGLVYQISEAGTTSVAASDNVSGDTSTTYQAWPCKTCDTNRPYATGHIDPCGLRPPPPCRRRRDVVSSDECGNGSSKSGSKRPRVAILSRLKSLICCTRRNKNTDQSQNQEIETRYIPEDNESPYASIDYLTVPF